MRDNSLNELHQLVWTALMAATIAAGAFLIVPIGPVPVSMQPFFVFLAGYALGPKRGALAVGLYILAGVIGLPVFVGGKSGLAHVLGPTGGYLVGFVVGAFLCGLSRVDSSVIGWRRGLVLGVLALGVVYCIGAGWLMFVLSLTWYKAWLIGVLPFIIWDGVKLVAALACCRYLAHHAMLPGQR